MFKFAASSPITAGGAAKKAKKAKKTVKKTAVKKNKKPQLMRGGGDCTIAGMFFEPSSQANQWVAGLPFSDSGDSSGNQNAVLSAFGSAESVVPYRHDIVMYTGSGISAPMGTPFSTGTPWAAAGGGRRVKKLTGKTTTTKKPVKKKKTPAKKK